MCKRLEAGRADLLLAAAGEILETMFFEELAPAGGEPPAGENLLAARVSFRGSCSGTLRLWVSAPASQRLASDFLALEDPGETGQRTGQVVSELANMVCGSVLSRLEAESAFQLDPPVLSGEPPEPGAVWAAIGEEGFLGLSLELESPA